MCTAIIQPKLQQETEHFTFVITLIQRHVLTRKKNHTYKQKQMFSAQCSLYNTVHLYFPPFVYAV